MIKKLSYFVKKNSNYVLSKPSREIQYISVYVLHSVYVASTRNTSKL
jgi:hypothetical protein